MTDIGERLPRASPRLAAISLEEWVTRHGPLWPRAAATLALEVCAQASACSPAQLRGWHESLTATHIVRGSLGEWMWQPVEATASSRTVHDDQIVERLGAILFHALTGRAAVHPFGDPTTLRARFSALRQDVPHEIVDLTIDALGARDRNRVTLADLARRLRRAIVTESERDARPLRRAGIAVAALGMVVLGVALTRSREVVAPHGLTAMETTLSDIQAEAAQVDATSFKDSSVDTALNLLNETDRRLRARFAADDPRIAWCETHNGWLWALADQRTTAQVYLTAKPSWLSASLGERHPYTRAARLLLAATHEARGAPGEAATLRAAADRATRDLLGDAHAAMVLEGVPAPPGVTAHVAPNAPVLEGFRQSRDGGWYTPLTRVQLRAAGRDGWRVHVVAADACKASFDVGLEPRRVEVDLARADGGWRARVEVAGRQATMLASASPGVTLTVMTDAGGATTMRLGEAALQPGPSAPANGEQAPVSPYGLTFTGGGCAVVWLEIPLPAK